MLAEQHGIDFVWTTEHHFANAACMPAQLPVLAFIAARTTRLQLGTCLFLLPFHNPLRVAEDVAAIDLLSNGRFTGFAAGSGSDAGEFESYDLDPKQRWGRLFEALAVIRRCFSEDEFDQHGNYFHFPHVQMTTKPVGAKLLESGTRGLPPPGRSRRDANISRRVAFLQVRRARFQLPGLLSGPSGRNSGAHGTRRRTAFTGIGTSTPKRIV